MAAPHPSAPPLALRVLLGCSLTLALFTVGFGVHFAGDWATFRAGKSEAEQRATLAGVPWFKRPFSRYVARLVRTIPPGERLLVEPSVVRTTSGDARWFLFLNYYAHPLEIYVRKPKWASGTLVDYPRWLAYHNKHPERSIEEELALQKRGIDWLLRYPVDKRFDPNEVELLHRVDGAWQPVELAGRGRTP